jgi:hypothetical protein
MGAIELVRIAVRVLGWFGFTVRQRQDVKAMPLSILVVRLRTPKQEQLVGL